MRKQRPSQSVSPGGDQSSRASEMDSSLAPIVQQTASKRKHPLRRRRTNSLRTGFAVVAGRTAGALSRRFHLGGGTSIIGMVAQRIDPDIIEHLATELEHGSVTVTGTNGKTTTSSFIAAILRDSGLRVWRNREGSNLMRGVASSLVIRAQPNGHLRRAGRAISILEVDEAALPQLVQSIPPRVAVFTNLFRDQLDRYGEVDSVAAYWKQAVKLLPSSTILVLNADDPGVAHLATTFAGKVLYYGIDDPALNLLAQSDTVERHQVIDTRTCPRCSGDYSYDLRFYSHMGHYRCAHCGFQRPEPDVRATRVQAEGFDRLYVQVTTANQQRDVVIPLPGLYNVYNALAATTAALALGLNWDPITTGIEQSKPVFGRGERVQAEGRTLRLLLAKNPTGFNEVLRTLFSEDTPRHVFFILNDNIADGRDISWIWDVDFERTVGRTKSIVVAGTRAMDLALRLKYAGVAQEQVRIVPPRPLRAAKSDHTGTTRQRGQRRPVSPNITLKHDTPPQRSYGLKRALDIALQQTPIGETLFVIPTYTALLEVHRELEQRGLTAHYWEGREA